MPALQPNTQRNPSRILNYECRFAVAAPCHQQQKIIYDNSFQPISTSFTCKTHESLPFTNAFYGTFTSWIRKINLKDSENVLSGAPGYTEANLLTTFLLSLREREEGGRGNGLNSFPTIGLLWKETEVLGSSRSTSVRN